MKKSIITEKTHWRNKKEKAGMSNTGGRTRNKDSHVYLITYTKQVNFSRNRQKSAQYKTENVNTTASKEIEYRALILQKEIARSS